MGGRGASGYTAIETTRNLTYDKDSMRSESLDVVRTQRAARDPRADRPIDIGVYGGKAHLEDGRHRLQVARERGDRRIRATVREYDKDGKLISKRIVWIDID